MQRQLTFSASCFPIEPGEDRETNPGLYGKALAHWLAGQLQRRGMAPEGVIAEDFGWVVMVARQPLMLWIGCCSEDGSHSEWRVFVAAETGWLRRLLKHPDPRPEVARLEALLVDILGANPGVHDLAWIP